ncbi:DUF1778 domain-containing protein [Parasutterella excrementihominis]|uniref:type II toxin-antitoxin system TacA family antitoxin n=1 Tax=Parasutterella excrementihominis TaxID=487175 RepID=UPI002673047C|nr:DUF1778 domain-containing protein [Parasutterella excrementihominis]
MTTTALERCDIRLSSEDKAFLQLAASLDGTSLSAFIRKAAISAAKDTMSKNDRYVLSGREVRELFSVLDNGFVPNKRLQEAMTIAEQIEKNGALNAGF